MITATKMVNGWSVKWTNERTNNYRSKDLILDLEELRDKQLHKILNI